MVRFNFSLDMDGNQSMYWEQCHGAGDDCSWSMEDANFMYRLKSRFVLIVVVTVCILLIKTLIILRLFSVSRYKHSRQTAVSILNALSLNRRRTMLKRYRDTMKPTNM